MEIKFYSITFGNIQKYLDGGPKLLFPQHFVDIALVSLLVHQIIEQAPIHTTRHFCWNLYHLTDFKEEMCATA